MWTLSAQRRTTPGRSGRTSVGVLTVALLALPACGGGEDAAEEETTGSATVYTCVSDDAIQPLISQFEAGGADGPGGRIELFRAPTGELNARVAGDVRSGGLRADVFWGCDPLTVQALVDQGLVGGWLPPEADDIPPEFRTDDHVGAHVLYMLAVHRSQVPAPRAWTDLAAGDYAVAVPDPSVAASALGALGWFAEEPGYGVDFYAELQRAGAVQVRTPDDVTTGVAQGIYDAGITHAGSAYAAQEDGSPVGVVWPEPGAVAIHGPIALATGSADSQVAKDFISYVLSADGQAVLGEAGSYPTRPGTPGPTIPEDAPVVFPDWTSIGTSKDAILADYQQVFGG